MLQYPNNDFIYENGQYQFSANVDPSLSYNRFFLCYCTYISNTTSPNYSVIVKFTDTKMEKRKHRKEKDYEREDIDHDIPSAPTMEDFCYDVSNETISKVPSRDQGVATFANDNHIVGSMQHIEISSPGTGML